MIKEINNTSKLLRVFAEIRRRRLEIGIFGDKDSFMAMIAKVNEFGVSIEVTEPMRRWFASQGYPLSKDTSEIKIPERSFIRGGFDTNLNKMQSYSVKQLKKLIEFEITIEQFYDRLGQYYVSRLKEYLTNISDPANSTMTTDRKGSANPLIGQDSRLRNSIIYRVVM
jgi:hypothetical protein